MITFFYSTAHSYEVPLAPLPIAIDLIHAPSADMFVDSSLFP